MWDLVGNPEDRFSRNEAQILISRMETTFSIQVLMQVQIHVRPEFFIFCFTDFFSQQVRGGGQNKNKNKIHSDHFPIELKLKETRESCFLQF